MSIFPRSRSCRTVAIALGAGNEEFRQKLEEMKKRRAEKGGDATGGQKPDMSEAMKQFGEMLKKKSQGGQ